MDVSLPSNWIGSMLDSGSVRCCCLCLAGGDTLLAGRSAGSSTVLFSSYSWAINEIAYFTSFNYCTRWSFGLAFCFTAKDRAIVHKRPNQSKQKKHDFELAFWTTVERIRFKIWWIISPWFISFGFDPCLAAWPLGFGFTKTKRRIFANQTRNIYICKKLRCAWIEELAFPLICSLFGLWPLSLFCFAVVSLWRYANLAGDLRVVGVGGLWFCFCLMICHLYYETKAFHVEFSNLFTRLSQC